MVLEHQEGHLIDRPESSEPFPRTRSPFLNMRQASEQWIETKALICAYALASCGMLQEVAWPCGCRRTTVDRTRQLGSLV